MKTMLFAVMMLNPNYHPLKVLIIDTKPQTQHVLLQGRINHSIAASGNEDPESFYTQTELVHGTQISSVIIYGKIETSRDLINHSICEDTVLDVCYSDTPDFSAGLIRCLKMAEINHYDIINLSYTGEDVNKEEFIALNDILNKNTIVVNSMGNHRKNLDHDTEYPSSYYISAIQHNGTYYKFKNYKNFQPVGSLQNEGPITENNISYFSNYSKAHKKDLIWEQGEGYYAASINPDFLESNDIEADQSLDKVYGTSFSAALHTHNLIMNHCYTKYQKIENKVKVKSKKRR